MIIRLLAENYGQKELGAQIIYFCYSFWSYVIHHMSNTPCISTYIYHLNYPNVGKYTMDGGGYLGMSSLPCSLGLFSLTAPQPRLKAAEDPMDGASGIKSTELKRCCLIKVDPKPKMVGL